MNQVDFGKVSHTIESVFGTTTECITPMEMKLSQSVFVVEVSSGESEKLFLSKVILKRVTFEIFQKVIFEFFQKVNSRDIGSRWGHFDRMIQSNIEFIIS